MRIVVQRVSEASVSIDEKVHARIGTGLLLLVGISTGDTTEDVEKLADKIVKLRIFNDTSGLMNLSNTDVDGHYLVISQFTLLADAAKGNRPSYIKAARPDQAIPLYEKFVERLAFYSRKIISTGVFGADMKITLINDGPVTILLDSKELFKI